MNMVEIYTAEMARNDVAATEQIRKEQEEKRWNAAIADAVERNLKDIYGEIRKRACKGVHSYVHSLYGVDCYEFYLSPSTLCRPIMEHLFNAGYTVDYEEVDEEDECCYDIYINW